MKPCVSPFSTAYRTTRYRPEGELLSDIHFKLIRAVEKFDPEKGSAFTFVSQVIANVLFTSVSNARKDSQRYRKLRKPVLDRLITNGETESGQIIADLTDRLQRNIKTSLEDAKEQDNGNEIEYQTGAENSYEKALRSCNAHCCPHGRDSAAADS